MERPEAAVKDPDAPDSPLPKNLYHSPQFPLEEWEAELGGSDITVHEISSISEIPVPPDGLNVVILDEMLLTDPGRRLLEAFALNHTPASLVCVVPSDGDCEMHESLSGMVSGVLQQPFRRSALMLALRGAFRHAAHCWSSNRSQKYLGTLSRNLDNLTKIGIALSAEQNHHKLFDMILTYSRELTNADAGSLYLVEENEDGKRSLRFQHTQNDSKDIPFQEFIMPATKSSISGYVAVTGETLNIPDVYDLPENVEYGFNKSFDQSVGYRSKSMLVVPMRDHENQITGVLQLINAKPSGDIQIPSVDAAERHVIAFDPAYEQLTTSLASQAAVALDNSMLIESIERTFDGLVKASVHAIEQRDPTTSGHSERVTELTIALARAVNETKHGRYAETAFTEEQLKELRYAGLLHDFGKIGVREHVLVKANKLYPMELEVLKSRFAFIKRTIESEYRQKMLEAALARDVDEVERLDQEMKERSTEVDAQLELVLRCDVPTMMPDGDFADLERLRTLTYRDLDGTEKTYITDYELKALTLRKGNLTEEERREIESHVSHSYDFLVQIPWTRALRGIPEIAHGHHEKLNGEGYPRGIKDEEIVLQAKMMCVCDIFDALTAADRPYKKAASLDRAIQILKFEVKDQHLCPELVDIFIQKNVYRAVELFKDVEYVEPSS